MCANIKRQPWDAHTRYTLSKLEATSLLGTSESDDVLRLMQTLGGPHESQD